MHSELGFTIIVSYINREQFYYYNLTINLLDLDFFVKRIFVSNYLTHFVIFWIH